MANRSFNTVQALERQIKIIAGTFFPNGSSAVDATANKGHGWSVARSDVGKFIVTLTDKYNSLIAGGAWLQRPIAGLNAAANIVAHDVSSAGTVTIQCHTPSDGTTEVEVAADANSQIHFVLILKNSSVF